MKTYKITVNGTAYDVVVEEVTGGMDGTAKAPTVKPAAPAAAPAKKATVVGMPIKAPMPGKILDVKVTEGVPVKKGQVVVVLEAMKMENEIVAPEDGVVADVAVTAGASVEAGDVLVSLN